MGPSAQVETLVKTDHRGRSDIIRFGSGLGGWSLSPHLPEADTAPHCDDYHIQLLSCLSRTLGAQRFVPGIVLSLAQISFLFRYSQVVLSAIYTTLVPTQSVAAMMLPSSSLVAIFQFLLLASSPLVRAGSDTSKNDKLSKPCTVQSPTSGMYFDLNAISLSPPEKKDGRKLHKDDRDESWLAKGHDYPANFTINICAPVIENISDVVGVDKSRWRNVSAYYEQNGKIYSIGYAR